MSKKKEMKQLKQTVDQLLNILVDISEAIRVTNQKIDLLRADVHEQMYGISGTRENPEKPGVLYVHTASEPDPAPIVKTKKTR